MGNLLRDIFDPNSEYNKQQRAFMESLDKKLRDDKCCCYCKNSEQVPHIEMGREAGTDDFCKIHQELMLGYGLGQQCLFWEERDAKNGS